MERLTEIVNGVVTYVGPECSYSVGLTAGEMPAETVRKVMHKLAAYEDTGLEPEEVKDNMEMFAAYRHTCGGLPPERVSELVEAEQKRREGCAMTEIEQAIQAFERMAGSGICTEHDKVALATLRRTAEDDKAREEGRLVVLPCKVGDTLYTESHVRGLTKAFEAPDLAWIVENLSLFGKTVFLTRQAAEAALGGGEV